MCTGTSFNMDKDGVVMRPHRGPHELQSWEDWAPDLGIETQLQRQVRATCSLSPFYRPQILLCLSDTNFIVVFITELDE